MANNSEQIDDGLWSTQDVMAYTGWRRTRIQKLLGEGVLPYIPGKPNKFVPNSVKRAIEKMQIGGEFGRPRKRRVAA